MTCRHYKVIYEQSINLIINSTIDRLRIREANSIRSSNSGYFGLHGKEKQMPLTFVTEPSSVAPPALAPIVPHTDATVLAAALAELARDGGAEDAGGPVRVLQAPAGKEETEDGTY